MQVSAAISTGDSSTFLSSASKECQNCRVIAQNLAHAYAEGGHIEDGKWTVLNLTRAGTTRKAGVWDVELRTARERWVDRDNHLVKVVDPDTLTVKVVVIREAAMWKVRELRIA
jgi:hypothetical protein